ncbi:MAG: MFS transporter, partial [Planctomycetaceae bacterium]|nr:MFS transporter [Planctomycetaceae bacterium]
ALASMGVTDEALRGLWFSRYVCAFLLGAAAGGVSFGWLGDHIGRSKALALSVLTFSLLAGLCYFVTTPAQMLVLWFFACTGVGGVWPNGISLASEAFPNVSRPWMAGLFGATANIGFMLISLLVLLRPVTPEDWRWVMLLGASPALLGFIILFMVPESPVWLASRAQREQRPSLKAEVFKPPILRYTIIGILLGAVPLMGNWGGSNWLVPWAGKVQEETLQAGLKAWTQWMKSGGGAVGSLLGGWLANLYGRRISYFFISLAALGSASYIYHFLKPGDDSFLFWVFVQGFFGTIYFGWLPLYLPELFPTRIRATGTGVTFNWGRILTAFGVLYTGQLLVMFGGDYARVGQWTCLVYVFGMIVICFAPDTHGLQLETSSEPPPESENNS